jgi:cytochrome b
MASSEQGGHDRPEAPRVLVWDLPTRLLHWSLAVGFLAAFSLAETRAGFVIHAILGLVVGLIALLRIVWGLVGTPHARFSSFPLRPGALFAYLRGAVTGSAKATVPHNPASAYLTLVMLAAALGLAVTGLLMFRGVRAAKEPHEVLAAVMLGSAALHLVGVAWHAWRHRDGIAWSMIHGKKTGSSAAAIDSPRTAVAMAFLVVLAGSAAMLVSGYDAATGGLQVPGLEWTIRQPRTHDGHHGSRHHHGRKSDDHREEHHDRDDDHDD